MKNSLSKISLILFLFSFFAIILAFSLRTNPQSYNLSRKTIMEHIYAATPSGYSLMDVEDSNHLFKTVGFPSSVLNKFQLENEENTHLNLPLEVSWGEKVDKNVIHTLSFTLKNNKNDEEDSKSIKNLEEMALRVSTPGDPLYGKHLTREEIQQILSNGQDQLGRLNKVKDFLESKGITTVENLTEEKDKNKCLNTLTLHAEAKIEDWEKLLGASFHYLELKSQAERGTEDETEAEKEGRRVARCPYYFLPQEISEEIRSVGNTVQFPSRFLLIKKGPRIMRPPHL